MNKAEIGTNIVHAWLAALIAFVLVPIMMIGASPEDYRYLDSGILLRAAGLFTLAMAAILTVGILLLHALRLGPLARLLSLLVLYWVLVTGFLLPVSVSTGMVDPERNPADKINFVIALLVVLALTLASLGPLRRYVRIFALVVVLGALAPAVTAIVASGILDPLADDHPSLTVSSQRNIFVVSFDGLPGRLVTELIREDARDAAVFKDFVAFVDTSSQSPATQASLLGEMYGVRDFKSRGVSADDVLETLGKEGLTDKLLAHQVADSYQYRYADYGIDSMVVRNPDQIAQQRLDAFDFFKYPIIRLWTRKALHWVDWQQATGRMKAQLIGSGDSQAMVARIRHHQGPNWDKPYLLDKAWFNTFTARLSVSDKPFSIRYMHLLFSHYPVDFDARCDYRSDDAAWFKAHQNEAGLKAQAQCVITVFGRFLDRLRALGIYDESLVVFKSDHGEPVRYFAEPPDNLTINGQPTWGYNRFRPTLLIKDFGRRQQRVEFDGRFALLNDLAGTLCRRAGVDADCDAFPGVDLLGPPAVDDAPYYLYVPSGPAADFLFKNHLSVRIPSRRKSLLDAMRDADAIRLGEPGPAQMTHAPH